MHYPYKPFHWIADFGFQVNNGLAKYLLEQIENYIKNEALIKTYSFRNHLLGVCIICEDRWYSEQLGFDTFKIPHLIAVGSQEEQQAIKKILLNEAVAKLTTHKPQATKYYLFARIPDADVTSIIALQEMDFVTVDSLITFAQIIRNSKSEIQNSKLSIHPALRFCVQSMNPALPEPERKGWMKGWIHPCLEDDLNAVLEIAFDAFIFDRFHADHSIPKVAADRVYSAWLKNSYKSGGVFVAKSDGKIAGFIAHRIKTISYLDRKIGIIDLVATNNVFRNQGVAKSLVNASLDYFRNQGACIAEVGTQAANLPAVKLYQSCGFRIITSSISLRKWL
jgi:ribosomal protein S18 acetylase RimI-like enzyme